MSMSEETAYRPLAKWLHWLTAVIVFVLLLVGLVMTRLEPGATQDRLFVLHESLGLTALVVMFLRAANRLRGAPEPAKLLSPVERRVSLAVHRALYVLLLLTPLLGWLALSAYGLGPSFFGVAELPALLAKNEPLSKTLFQFHFLGALLIGALALLHVAGALRHLSRRDGLI
jgi:cytochrome b561